MKSFKTLMSEVAQPSERGAEEEQAFKDQHSYEVMKHPVALDHQHTGEILKPGAPLVASGARTADQRDSANYDTAYAYGMNAMMDNVMGEEVEEFAEDAAPTERNTIRDKVLGKMANALSKNENSAAAKAKALDKATAATAAGKKAVTLEPAPWDKKEALVGGQKELDHDKDGDIDGSDFAALRAKKKAKTESLDEAYKAGIVKFKDGKQSIIKKEDADLLNKMLKDLSPASRKSMSKVAETDQAGFDEILGFAREAL